MIRNIRTLVIATTAMAWVTAHAFDPNIDLKDSTFVGEGQCDHGGMTYKCFMLKNDKDFHIIVVDILGPLAIYKVKEIKKDYKPEDVELVWQRQSRRKEDMV